MVGGGGVLRWCFAVETARGGVVVVVVVLVGGDDDNMMVNERTADAGCVPFIEAVFFAVVGHGFFFLSDFV